MTLMKTLNNFLKTFVRFRELSFILLSMGLILTLPIYLAMADDARMEEQPSEIKESVKIERVLLQNMFENTAVINDEEFIFTDRTKFYKGDNEWQRYEIDMSELRIPCTVSIIYRTYSHYSEKTPFRPDEKVLVSVSVLNN